MAILGVNKRVSQLDQFDDPTKPDGPRIDDLMAPAQKNLPAYSANWWIPLDYKLPEGDALDSDLGTMRLPFSRVAMLDQYGKVPLSMLPGYVDECVYGTMRITRETGTPDQFVFEEVSYEHEPGQTYACPTQEEGELPPVENLVYVAKEVYINGVKLSDPEVQYRYNKNENSFTVIEHSRAMVAGKGIKITPGETTVAVDIGLGEPAARDGEPTNPLQFTNNKLVHATSGVTTNDTEVFKFIRQDTDGKNMVASVTVDKTGHITDVTNDSDGRNITGYAEYYSKKAVYDDGDEMRGPLYLPACSERDRSVIYITNEPNGEPIKAPNTGKFVGGLLGGRRYHISLDFQYKVGHAANTFDRLTSYIKFSENDTNPITLSDSVIDRSMAFPQYFHIDATFKPAGSGSVTGELGLIPGLPSSGSYGTWPPIYANTDDRVSVIRYSIRELL